MKMNNVITKKNSLAYSNTKKWLKCSNSEIKLMLGGKYTIFWTPTARNRAENTYESSTVIFGVYLKNLLKEISAKTSWLNEYNGYITLRDFKTGLFAVINVEKTSRKIRVITCGKVKEIYPHCNDLVIQRNRDGLLIKYIWTFKKNNSQ